MKMFLMLNVLLLSSCVHYAEGLTCLKCDSVPQPRLCSKVVECFEGESCSVQKILNEFGEHVYKLGCLSNKVCSSFTNTSLSSTISCSECCDSSDLCNSKGCGEPGYPAERGPVCLKCPLHTDTGQCHDIEFCFIGEVCNIVGKNLFSSLVYASKCISKHLLITLQFVAKGEFYSEGGLTQGVSKSSVCRCIWQVIAAIDHRLQNIGFPTNQEELNQIKRKFYSRARVPNCIGAVDCTLIEIISPCDREEVYVCRKGYHAINVQAVVDTTMKFTNVVAKWPGSTHDSVIFENSGLKQWLDGGNHGWLVGDSGYALKQYMLTPKVYEPCHKQTNILRLRPVLIQIIPAVWSGFIVFI